MGRTEAIERTDFPPDVRTRENHTCAKYRQMPDDHAGIVRRDPVAEAYPIITEVEKPEKEKGKYLYPVEYGQPRSMGIRPEKPSISATTDFSEMGLGQRIRATKDALERVHR